MLLGDFIIVACPHCGSLEKYLTLISGNTLNCIVWSDGRVYADMMIFLKEVVACHNCGEAYWLKEAKEVGRHEPYKAESEFEHPEFYHAPEVKEPDLAGYHHAIEIGMARSREQEATLRWLAWCKANDPARSYIEHPVAEPVIFTPENEANMMRLAELYDPVRNTDRMFKAEIFRELKHFDEALALLENHDFEDCQWIADRILSYAKAGNPELVMLNPMQDYQGAFE